MAIWSFRCKRFPDGTLNRYNACICAYGGQQQWGINYCETHAPVVIWISIRFLLVIFQLAGLEIQTINVVLAFPQADLNTPVYMEIPSEIYIGPQIEKHAYCLYLKLSLYELKQTPHNWYECLKKGIECQGFSVLKADPCVFMKKDKYDYPVFFGDMISSQIRHT